MLIEKLIKDNPKFHLYQGTPTSWSTYPETLRFLHSVLTPGMSTLETGCGQSTVVFSIAGTNHTCITPDPGEAERVKQYCAELGLEKNIHFIIESSDVALPRGERIPSRLDFVLIDGAHGFPAPIIDWHYTVRRLKVGGILSVDDFKMPSVRILYDFLYEQDEWELIKIVRNTAFFKKLWEPKDIADWTGSKMNRMFQGDRFITRYSRAKAFIKDLVQQVERTLNIS